GLIGNISLRSNAAHYLYILGYYREKNSPAIFTLLPGIIFLHAVWQRQRVYLPHVRWRTDSTRGLDHAG
ncbi:hypothetical protein ACJ8PQ_22340, partial [Serratia sp. CY74664]|uniref:hypothetical protein n=1 Tax=Serratia sp. CY74664 TaxID=3383676 RepID=UPI003FA029C9